MLPVPTICRLYYHGVKLAQEQVSAGTAPSDASGLFNAASKAVDRIKSFIPTKAQATPPSPAPANPVAAPAVPAPVATQPAAQAAAAPTITAQPADPTSVYATGIKDFLGSGGGYNVDNMSKAIQGMKFPEGAKYDPLELRGHMYDHILSGSDTTEAAKIADVQARLLSAAQSGDAETQTWARERLQDLGKRIQTIQAGVPASGDQPAVKGVEGFTSEVNKGLLKSFIANGSAADIEEAIKADPRIAAIVKPEEVAAAKQDPKKFAELKAKLAAGADVADNLGGGMATKAFQELLAAKTQEGAQQALAKITTALDAPESNYGDYILGALKDNWGAAVGLAGIALMLFGGDWGKLAGTVAMAVGGFQVYNQVQRMKDPAAQELAKQYLMAKGEAGGKLTWEQFQQSHPGYYETMDPSTGKPAAVEVNDDAWQGARTLELATKLGFANKAADMVMQQANELNTAYGRQDTAAGQALNTAAQGGYGSSYRAASRENGFDQGAWQKQWFEQQAKLRQQAADAAAKAGQGVK